MHPIALAALALLIGLLPARATEAGWALMRNGGQVVLLTHTDAPGTGEPANFDVENCRTQRNLSERGRNQARRLGSLMAARAAPVEEVHASRYCRTLDTASLAFPDNEIEEMEALDALNAQSEDDNWQQPVIDLASGYSGSGNMIMVTHPANVEALTGARPRDGEATIVIPGESGLERIGRIVFN